MVVKYTFFFQFCFVKYSSYSQDFYLDLVEDNRKITPRDYLELALRPVQGSGKDIAAKNEVICNMDFNWGNKRNQYQFCGGMMKRKCLND